MNEDLYLIYSTEHSAWWKSGGWGYTRDVKEAGHFTREQAWEICGHALPTAQHIHQLSEFPVRVADVRDMIDTSAYAEMMGTYRP